VLRLFLATALLPALLGSAGAFLSLRTGRPFSAILALLLAVAGAAWFLFGPAFPVPVEPSAALPLLLIGGALLIPVSRIFPFHRPYPAWFLFLLVTGWQIFAPLRTYLWDSRMVALHLVLISILPLMPPLLHEARRHRFPSAPGSRLYLLAWSGTVTLLLLLAGSVKLGQLGGASIIAVLPVWLSASRRPPPVGGTILRTLDPIFLLTFGLLLTQGYYLAELPGPSLALTLAALLFGPASLRSEPDRTIRTRAPRGSPISKEAHLSTAYAAGLILLLLAATLALLRY